MSGELDDLEAFAVRLVDAWGEAVAAYLDRMGPLVRSLAEVVSDPQVQAAVAARQLGKAMEEYRPCHCLCGYSHREVRGICDAANAVTTRRYATEALGVVDVPLCGPCAGAQGIEVPIIDAARGGRRQ